MNHANTLTSVYFLSHLLGATQNYHEALDLYQRAIIRYDKVLGPRHPTIVACQQQGRYWLRKLIGANSDGIQTLPRFTMFI